MSEIGSYGIWIDKNSKKIKIINSLLYNLGAGGIRIGRGKPLNDMSNITMRSMNNLINNAIICNGGYIFKEGNPILLQHSNYNNITFNEICHFQHIGINVGWDWNYTPTEYASNHNLIAWNKIHHLGFVFYARCVLYCFVLHEFIMGF